MRSMDYLLLIAMFIPSNLAAESWAQAATDTAVSASVREVAPRTAFTAERIRLRPAMLRSLAFSLVRTRLAADLWCGIDASFDARS